MDNTLIFMSFSERHSVTITMSAWRMAMNSWRCDHCGSQEAHVLLEYWVSGEVLGVGAEVLGGKSMT